MDRGKKKKKNLKKGKVVNQPHIYWKKKNLYLYHSIHLSIIYLSITLIKNKILKDWQLVNLICMYVCMYLFSFFETGFLCRPGWPRTQKSACLCLWSAGITATTTRRPIIISIYKTSARTRARVHAHTHTHTHAHTHTHTHTHTKKNF